MVSMNHPSVVRGQEDGCSSDIQGIGQGAGGHPRHVRRLEIGVVEQRPYHVRHRGAGADQVDVDSVRPPLDCERFGQQQHAAFR